MSQGTNLLKDKRFHDWYLQYMIQCYIKAKGIGENQSRVELSDSLSKEMNSLHFVLENVYPHSRPSNDKHSYVFITEPVEHDMWTAPVGQNLFYPGRIFLQFDIKNTTPIFKFPDNPNFHHGHVTDGTGYPTCYGHFRDPSVIAVDSGFAGLLGEMYAFGCKSKASTRLTNV